MTLLTPPTPPYWLTMILRAIMAVVEGVSAVGRGVAWFAKTVNWGITFAITIFNWTMREFIILPTPNHYWGAVTIRFCSSLVVALGAGLISGVARRRLERDHAELLRALRERTLAGGIHPDHIEKRD